MWIVQHINRSLLLRVMAWGIALGEKMNLSNWLRFVMGLGIAHLGITKPFVNFYICHWKEIHPCNTLLALGVLYGAPTLKNSSAQPSPYKTAPGNLCLKKPIRSA